MARGLARAPKWAWAVIGISVAVLAVGVPLTAGRGKLSAAEAHRIETSVAAESQALAEADTAAKAAAKVTLPTKVDSVVVFGDSYTDPTRAPGSQTYIQQVAKTMGWPEPEVLPTSGGGYMSPGSAGAFRDLIPKATSEDPDVVVIQGGRNDYKWDGLHGGVNDTLRLAITRWPHAVVVVVGVLWPQPVPDEVAAANRVIITTADAYDRAIPVDFIAAGLNYELGPDGVHPNRTGDQQIAAAMVTALRGQAMPSAVSL